MPQLCCWNLVSWKRLNWKLKRMVSEVQLSRHTVGTQNMTFTRLLNRSCTLIFKHASILVLHWMSLVTYKTSLSWQHAYLCLLGVYLSERVNTYRVKFHVCEDTHWPLKLRELLDIIPWKDRTCGIDVKETTMAAFVKANCGKSVWAEVCVCVCVCVCDVALCSNNTVKNVSLSPWLDGHPCCKRSS